MRWGHYQKYMFHLKMGNTIFQK